MKLIFAASAIALACMSSVRADVIDTTVTLTSLADVAARRAALINETWGTNTLPTDVSTVTQIANPFGSTLPDVAGVYQYESSVALPYVRSGVTYSDTFVHDDNLYMSSHPNGDVVILSMGHQNSTAWQSFNPSYNTAPTMSALLQAGFSILAYNMPGGGNVFFHRDLFNAYGDVAMRDFLQPAVEAMNYWNQNHTFTEYDAAGLSGGAWTGTVLQALDTRVMGSVLVAGSQPGTQFCCTNVPGAILPNQADLSAHGAEQNWLPFYSIAGYADLYVMGASGAGRSQLQILNIHDDCCFGPLQWNQYYVNGNNGRNWYQQVDYYTNQVQSSPVPVNFTVVEDTTSTSHQISNPFAVNLLVNTLSLEAVPEPTTVSIFVVGLLGLGMTWRRSSLRRT